MKNRCSKLCRFLFIFALAASGNAFAQRNVTFAATEWEPYSGQDLPSYGFHTEITVEAMNRMGYEVEILFFPWERGLHMVRSGEIDAILTVYFTEERAESLEFTDPVTNSTTILMRRKDSPLPDSFNSLAELSSYSIGVVRGYSVSPEFDAADYLNKDYANSGAMNLLKFLNGRVDLIADAKEILLYQLRTNHPEFMESVDILDPPLESQNVYNGFSKAIPGYEQIVVDFNRGLQQLKEDGTFARILERHGVQ